MEKQITEEQLEMTVDRFWETVPPTWNRIRGRIRATAEEFEITVEQFHILRHIRKGIGTSSELAEAKQISRPAVSQAIEVLVQKGLVSRRRSLDDRRRVKLELTESGNELLNAIFMKNRAWMKERLMLLDEADFTCLFNGLRLLRETFDERVEKSFPVKQEAHVPYS